jgi:hypothetical protein
MTKKRRCNTSKRRTRKRVAAALKKYVKRATGNPARSRSVSLRGFTGRIRVLPGGGVRIQGRGAATRENVAAGFVDEEGIFHPIRASYDYSSKRAGEGGKKKASKKKKKGKKR